MDFDGNGYFPLVLSTVTVTAEPDGSNDGIHALSFYSDDWAGNSETPFADST